MKDATFLEILERGGKSGSFFCQKLLAERECTPINYIKHLDKIGVPQELIQQEKEVLGV